MAHTYRFGRVCRFYAARHYAIIAAAAFLIFLQESSADEHGRETIQFPQEQSDLKADPAALFGKLENGLRYVVVSNREPRDRVSLRLLVIAGSLEEKDDQRGLAHFLEHMAFNGSTHFPPGMLVEFLQRMGMSVGADVNANTNFDRTIYRLELAHADTPTIAEGLRVFGDYAAGLLLNEQQIDKERRIILAEKRANDSPLYRNFVAQLEATLGTTLLPRRLPIGLPEIISTTHRQSLLDFWNAWYRPERMLLIVVGDFTDPGEVEKMLRGAVGDVRARADSRPNPKLGEPAKFEGVRAFYHGDLESPFTNVSIQVITPYMVERDTSGLRVARLNRLLASAMLNRRFTILSKQEGAPFTFAGVNVSENWDFVTNASVFLACKPENWEAALATGEQELRRALEHGFTAAELAEAAAIQLNQSEQAAKGTSTRRSNEVADKIVDSFMSHRVFTSPSEELALVKSGVNSITPDACLQALRKDFSANGRFISVIGNAALNGDAATTIAAAYKHSQEVPVTAPAAEAKRAWTYTDFGVPGTIVKREHLADLAIDLITFSNGTHLSLKKTDFEAGRVTLTASVGTGILTEPADKQGLSMLAANTFIAGGLGKYSADDLHDLFAGKNVGWQFAPETDTFQFSSTSTPDDLLLDLQLLCAELTDPGYRPESLRVAQKNLDLLYGFLQHTINGPLSIELSRLVANGDHRFGTPPQATLMARNLDEVKAWLNPQLKRGALEVGLVGDFDVEKAIKAATTTIAALPAREPKPTLSELKNVSFPAQPFTRKYTFNSEIAKGAVVVYWPTDDGLDVRRVRRLNLLADILNDQLRLKLRETIGATYTPQVQNNSSETYPHYGYITATIDVAPADAGRIREFVVDIADNLKQHGVTDDEFKRAREPMLSAFQKSRRDNNYWLNSVVARAQEKPEWLDWSRTGMPDVEGITASEMSALAAKYLQREHASSATILPSAPGATR